MMECGQGMGGPARGRSKRKKSSQQHAGFQQGSREDAAVWAISTAEEEAISQEHKTQEDNKRWGGE